MCSPHVNQPAMQRNRRETLFICSFFLVRHQLTKDHRNNYFLLQGRFRLYCLRAESRLAQPQAAHAL